MMRVLLIVIIGIEWQASVAVNWCDPDTYGKPEFAELARKVHHYDHFAEQNVCYFHVYGATEDASEKPDRTKENFFFNVTKARAICAKYGGTLLTFKDETEATFVQDAARHGHCCHLVLGIQKAKGAARVDGWDGDLHSKYHPKIWEGATMHDEVTVMLVLDSGSKWESLSDTSRHVLQILCQQRLIGNDGKPVDPTPSPGGVEEVTTCPACPTCATSPAAPETPPAPETTTGPD